MKSAFRLWGSVATTLALGSAGCATLYWTLLNTPESNAVTLAASALLVIAGIAVAGTTVNAAVLIARGTAFRAALPSGLRGIGWFLVAVTPLVLAWMAIARFDAWTTEHQGEINAWFIARLGWADISRLFWFETWMSRWLRFAILPASALSLLAALLTPEGARRTVWLRRAIHWRSLAMATTVFVLLWALPWQLTAWRPQLPPTWLEPVLASVRLGVIFGLFVAGAAIIVLISVSTFPATEARTPGQS